MPSVASNGACPGSTPKYPRLPGATTSSTSAETTKRVGVASSSVRRSATYCTSRSFLALSIASPMSPTR